MTSRFVSLLAGTLFLVLVFASTPLHAQEWQQEVQIITSLENGDPVSVMLDSIVSVLDRNPDTRVRRSPQDSTATPFHALQDELYEDGIDPKSATHAFIRYRFDLRGEGNAMVETIKDIYFISRFNESYSDVPLLYVSTSDPAVNNMLISSGIPSEVNMKSFTAFRKMVAFPVINRRSESTVVEMGGRALRGDLTPQQRMVLEHLTEYASRTAEYILTTNYDHRVAPPYGAFANAPMGGRR